MTALRKRARGANLLYALAGMCSCCSMGLAGPASEMSGLWMQCTAATPVARDTHKKPSVMIAKYMLVVKHSGQTSSELEIMHKKA